MTCLTPTLSIVSEHQSPCISAKDTFTYWWTFWHTFQGLLTLTPRKKHKKDAQGLLVVVLTMRTRLPTMSLSAISSSPDSSYFLNTSSSCCQLCLFCFSPVVPQTPLVKCQPVCQLADSALDAKHLLGEDFPHKYCMCPDLTNAFVAERNTQCVTEQ